MFFCQRKQINVLGINQYALVIPKKLQMKFMSYPLKCQRIYQRLSKLDVLGINQYALVIDFKPEKQVPPH